MTQRPRVADASGLSGAWFEATAGTDSLRLYAGGAPRHAADAAIALARCEALLDGLDDWLGVALDWRWIAAPAAVTANATHARIHWRGGDTAKYKDLVCRVEMPWSLLRTLPAPDDTLDAQLHWPDVPVVLTIARVAIGRDELADLEAGGAVVLADSMQRSWQGLLRSLDDAAIPGAGLPVSLASPWTPRRIKLDARVDPPREAAGGKLACEVRMTSPNVVPGDRLTPWYEGEVGAVGGQAGLWRSATEREPAALLATGELMPWGDGWALAIEQVSEIRQD